MPGTTSTALPSFSHGQHHGTDAANRKGVDRSSTLPGGPLGGLPSLSLTTEGSWIHLGGESPNLSSARWRQYPRQLVAMSYIFCQCRTEFYYAVNLKSNHAWIFVFKFFYCRPLCVVLLYFILSRWRRIIVVRTLVSTGELSLSCARLLAWWVTTLRLSRSLSVSQHGQLSHPSLRGR